MTKGLSYWNKYEIGKVHFVENTKDHPHRKMFVDYVIGHCDSVIEVGPGEMLEYQALKAHKPVDYAISDVSTAFLDNCSHQYPEVKRINCSMEELDASKVDRKYDIIYGSSVLEHSPDLKKSLSNWSTVAYKFFFVLFKWKYKGGNLSSRYFPAKGRYSSIFNAFAIIDELNGLGAVEQTRVVSPDGRIKSLKPRSGVHRNGDRLIIIGDFNGE